MAQYNDKCKATAKRLREKLVEEGLQWKQTNTYYRETEVMDGNGKHFATVCFTQKYSMDPVNIRVTHAGMTHADEYSYTSRQHNVDPYSEWHWAGRNYKLVDSAVNAIVKFRSSIASDDEAKLAKLGVDVDHAYRLLEAERRVFKGGFSVDQLIRLLALAGDDPEFAPQVRMLNDISKAEAAAADAVRARKAFEKGMA